MRRVARGDDSRRLQITARLLAAALLGVITLRAFGFGLAAVCAAFLAATTAFFV